MSSWIYYQAQQQVHGENWYRGTADAVNLNIIRRYDAEYVVILAGDHIYKQDYSRMLLDHVEKGARAVPWPACRSPVEKKSAFGVMAVDYENDKSVEFVEKPAESAHHSRGGGNPLALPVWAIYVCLMRNISAPAAGRRRRDEPPPLILAKIFRITAAGEAYARPFPTLLRSTVGY